jgi:GNAT superfamily N-acetyltransferase
MSLSMASYTIRAATMADVDSLTALIALSARGLSTGEYAPEQVEGALRGAFGVDTQLIRDGTYFIVEAGGVIVACGGWSFRKTLFGSDTGNRRDPAELDPSIDAAKIRAFFVDPAHARRGIGTLLLEHCEAAARARGFTRVELMATLPGLKLYAARGYVPTGRVTHEMEPGLTIEFVPMLKSIAPARDNLVS